jgi:hypothetical protein
VRGFAKKMVVLSLIFILAAFVGEQFASKVHSCSVLV